MIYAPKKKKSKSRKIIITSIILIFIVGILTFFVTLNRTVYKEERRLEVINRELCKKYNLICGDIYVNYNDNTHYILVNNVTTKVYDEAYNELLFVSNENLYPIKSLKKRMTKEYDKLYTINYYYTDRLLYEVKAVEGNNFIYSYYDATNGNFVRSYKVNKEG